MKIVQISYTGFGGLASVVFSLIEADRSDNQWFIGFYGDQALDEAYPPRCDLNKVEYKAFISSRLGRLGAWRALVDWLGTIQPDAIICHSITAVLPCKIYSLRARIPLITVEHTSNQVKSKSERIASWVSMLISSKVVLLTHLYAEELAIERGVFFRKNKFTVIPNGIDTECFSPCDKKQIVAKNRWVIGMAARFSFSKCQALLVDVMVLLREKLPNIQFELRLAGNGETLETVRNKVNLLSSPERIIFDGLLTEAEIPDWYRSIDIYVHATAGETLSTSLLQAMAVKLPIVSSAIPGVSNLLIDHNHYGYCVANEAEQFSNAIVECVTHAKSSEKMAQRARHKVQQNYSNKIMLERYLALVARSRSVK